MLHKNECGSSSSKDEVLGNKEASEEHNLRQIQDVDLGHEARVEEIIREEQLRHHFDHNPLDLHL